MEDPKFVCDTTELTRPSSQEPEVSNEFQSQSEEERLNTEASPWDKMAEEKDGEKNGKLTDKNRLVDSYLRRLAPLLL